MRHTSAWPLAWLWVAVIVYASLYPFSPWRDQGLSFWAFLSAPWPRYWSGFDVASNVLGYAPLGFLFCLSALRLGRLRLAVWWTSLGGLVLSLLMEGLQSYLPLRVPSAVDAGLNTLGTALGAVVAKVLEQLGWLARWTRFRQRWFAGDAYFGLVLLVLWPVALLFPVAVPLGLGQIWERLEEALSRALMDTPLEDWMPLRTFELEPLLPGAQLLCVALGLLVPCLLGYGVMRAGLRRAAFAGVIGLLALGATALSAALTYGPVHSWDWLDPPARWGLSMGFVLALALVPLPPRACHVLLLIALVVQQSLLNRSIESPYFALALLEWEQGRFIRFHGLVQWLSWLWPYAAMLYAVAHASRERARA
ncbi:MAG: VanZ family protein [Limnohabitans sp.]|nr:VanZ family protein [Limnohabitans sp.]